MYKNSFSELVFDEWGFLTDFSEWTIDFANEICTIEGISFLTESHWRLINFLRDYYMKNNCCPRVKIVIESTGFSLREIYNLFPYGLVQSAFKIAGLPKPEECN